MTQQNTDVINQIDEIGGPWFEDFQPGDKFDEVPSVTLTQGHAALYQAMTGDRQRLPLDIHLSHAVTGSERALVNPIMVFNFMVGQTTVPSQRVLGNLFYRGLIMRHPVFVEDTLTTRTQVVGLKQNRPKAGRAASGMVALEITVTNQHDKLIAQFWRCPMIPCRDPEVRTGYNDDFSSLPGSLAREDLLSSIPDWDYQRLRKLFREPSRHLQTPTRLRVEARDTVTMAPELVRLTLNLAMTHTDVGRSVYDKRLVYGGHTISIAAAQLSRVFPDMVSILAWHQCDHTAPVFEEDILQSEVIVQSIEQMNSCALADVRIIVMAERAGSSDQELTQVLDWQLIALLP